MVPHGKQAGMRSVNLRGMVEIDPYKDDLFPQNNRTTQTAQIGRSALLLAQDFCKLHLWIFR
jgi:hypothetical protein